MSLWMEILGGWLAALACVVWAAALDKKAQRTGKRPWWERVVRRTGEPGSQTR